MRTSGMIQVDPSHFSNVIGAVQRTGSLTGGAVRGLPGGVVIDGLTGINAFASGVAEAQKEFELGRTQSALERIRQLESQFNGIAGRWDSNVRSLISSTKQGRQQLPLQKLNEVKNAQARMQLLTGPTSKAFRDLISALEHTVAMEGQKSEETPHEVTASESTEPSDIGSDSEHTPTDSAAAIRSDDGAPDASALGSFAADYRCGAKLRLRRGEDNKAHIVPKLEKDGHYFVTALDPPRVVQVKKLRRKAVVVLDTLGSTELTIESRQLSHWIKQGTWALQHKTDHRSQSCD